MNLSKNLQLSIVIFIVGIVLVLLVGVNLYAPVEFKDNGEFSSLAFVPGALTAELTVYSDSDTKSFDCESGECNLAASQAELEEGKYNAIITAHNPLGMTLATRELVIEIDSTPPDLFVTHPEFSNKETVEIQVETELGANVKAGEEDLGIYADEALVYNFELNTELTDPQEIVFTATDAAGNTQTYVAKITFDNQITLTIKKPKKGNTVANRFKVTGTTDAMAKIIANGVRTKADKDGKFTVTVNFKNGGVTVKATDSAGNTKSKKISLNRQVVATTSGSSSTGGGSTTTGGGVTACSRFGSVSTQVVQNGSASVIVSASNLANRDAVLAYLSSADFALSGAYSSIPAFYGTLYPSGMNKMCGDAKVTSVQLNGVVSAQ